MATFGHPCCHRTVVSNYKKILRPGLAIDLLVVIGIFVAISWYQTRDLLDNDAELAAPGYKLTSLAGKVHTNTDLTGKPAIIYFFAPWCRICNLSAHNLQSLRNTHGEEDVQIVFVALNWESLHSVKKFAKRHNLTVPVLLGNEQIARDYHIKGFPTYYVLDSKNRIVGRDYGYTTNLGLRYRLWMAE